MWFYFDLSLQDTMSRLSCLLLWTRGTGWKEAEDGTVLQVLQVLQADSARAKRHATVLKAGFSLGVVQCHYVS